MTRLHDILDQQAATRPQAPALSDSAGMRLDWRQMAGATAELAAQLAQAGVARGDRVLIVAENCVPAVAALFACSRLGATAVPVNARQSGSEIQRLYPLSAQFDHITIRECDVWQSQLRVWQIADATDPEGFIRQSGRCIAVSI